MAQYASHFHGKDEVEGEEVLVPSRRGKGYWVAWVSAMAVMGMVAGGLVVLFLKFVDGPVEGVAASSLNKAKAATATKPTQPNMLSGLAIEFQYPSIFDTVGQVKTDAQATEQYNIGSKMSYQRVITVAVRPLVSGNLEDDASYRFRQFNTTEYRAVAQKINGETASLMLKLNNQEQTLFWAHRGQIATVSVTSSDPKDDLTAIMKMVISTIRWRQ